MKILVLGGGVIGVTTAYELQRDGHEITVVDRQPEPAGETSFANAGLIAPGHAFAWASPKVPGILLKSLVRNDQAFRLRLSSDPEFWRWTLKFLGQCTAARARHNTLRKHALCVLAQARLDQVAEETGIDFHRTEKGLLYLYRSREALDRAALDYRVLSDHGQAMEVIDTERVIRIDPALSGARDQIAGAIFSPDDESGDCRLFTQRLAEICASRGAVFHYDTLVQRIESGAGRVTQIVTDRGSFTADCYVVCLGPYSPVLVRPAGIHLDVYPVKGYSVTVPIGTGHTAPTVGAVDEHNLIAYVRLGDQLRLTATAEFAGYDTTHRPGDFEHMLAIARSLFPRGADYSRPQYWACLRPMTPNGMPVISRSRIDNLILNTGHGHLGWTMACGAARMAADLISS